MKFLVAALGNRLDSFVAKRFEHAAWYLVVDDDTNIVEATRHLTPHDRHNLLHKAASGDFDIVVAGKLGDSTRKLLRSSTARIALVHGVTTSAALDKIRSDDVHAIPAEGIGGEKEIAVRSAPQGSPKIRRVKATHDAIGFSSDSSRGHHHLQQYGGRGH